MKAQTSNQNNNERRRMAIIGIEYKEWQPQTYKAVILSLSDDNYIEPIVFNKWNNPAKDYAEAFARTAALGIDHVMHSSTVDNFIMDGGFLTV